MRSKEYDYLTDVLDTFCHARLPTISTDFNLDFVAPPAWLGFSTSATLPFEQNVELRRYLARHWLGMTLEERRAAVKFYIVDWGGVRGNHPETLQSYADRSEVEIVTHSALTGVASWSKALSFRMRNNYAILDARVGAALNAIQILYGSGLAYRFPDLPSQSGHVVPFNKALRSAFPSAPEITGNDLYARYCQLTKASFATFGTKHSSGMHWHAVETALFFHAPALMAAAQSHALWGQQFLPTP